MGSVLIAMPKSEDAYHIARSLSERGQLLDTEVCVTGADILRISHDRDYGVVICTRQLKDMSYMELAGYLPEYFGMIVLTRDPELDTYADNIIKLMMPFKTSKKDKKERQHTDKAEQEPEPGHRGCKEAFDGEKCHERARGFQIYPEDQHGYRQDYGRIGADDNHDRISAFYFWEIKKIF